MTIKFQNKYRIPSARLQNWDYRWNASYFVTICTRNRKHYFGDIADGKIQLSEIGQMAKEYWGEIPKHFSFVQSGAFVIMPNHVHGIVIIDRPDNDNNDGRDAECDVERNMGVGTNTADHQTTHQPRKTNPSRTTAALKKWKPASLGVIINQYKRIVTINARKIDAEFGWQSRFHDHIIRNPQSFQKIETYIIENPKNWKQDKFCN